MAITKEQWQQIEAELSGSFGRVRLTVNGTRICLKKCFISENKLAIIVYLDDALDPVTGIPSQERFDPRTEQLWRKRTKARYPAKFKADIIKIYGKRRANKEYPELAAMLHWFEPYFPTFSPLKSQYSKLDDLAVVSIGFTEDAA